MKKAIRKDFYVAVYPRSAGDFGYMSISGQSYTEAEEEALCDDIAQQIIRHIDGLPSRKSQGVEVRWEKEYVCSFCGAEWEAPMDSPHNYGCCDKDAENMPDEEDE